MDMSNQKPKTINALMRYLRDEKNIAINGSSQKVKLMNMGYYHGYKGYRFFNKPSNQFSLSDFNQLLSIYEYDAKLKSLFYPQVMLIETALKNYTLEIIIQKTNSAAFQDIYSQLLTNYCDLGGDARVKAQCKRLKLRDKVHSIQTSAYGNKNQIATHFIDDERSLPIWAIFELMTLGEFGNVIACLRKPYRAEVSQKLGIRQADDVNALLVQNLIYALTDLRNAIAHNNVVFDTRFKTANIRTQVAEAIKSVSGIHGIDFSTITDYLVLIVYFLKMFNIPKTDLRRLISSFIECNEKLRSNTPTSVFNRIIHTDNTNKLNLLLNYI
jgi:abortive infection bacteriophage resistance protein